MLVICRVQRQLQRQQQQQRWRWRRGRLVAATAAGAADDEGSETSLASDFMSFINQAGVDAPMPPSRPTHLMSPTTCIAVQMNALQRNDYPEKDAGVRTAFLFTKPEGAEDVIAAPAVPQRVRSWAAREEWLAFADFSNQLHSPPFGVLLHCDAWQPISQLVFPSKRHMNKAVCAVEVTSATQQRQAFTFCLEKVEQGPWKNVWLTAEGPLQGLAELFGATGDDPGHWNLSPEWWGNLDGGWGRDAGVVVFAADSECGNGHVTVTAHPASATGQAAAASQGGWEEWRVLRFNGVTRQSVARVWVQPAAGSGAVARNGMQRQQPHIEAQAACLAQEYLKTAASVVAALLGLQGLLEPHQPAHSSGGNGSGANGKAHRLRALCIGVGGGSLPLFLSHHFPRMDVDAVELDPAVVAAATRAMGLPAALPSLRLHTADAAAFLRERCGGHQGQAQPPYDLVFMDAYDGSDDVPATLCTPGASFARLVASALHPSHGCFLVNLHSMEDRATVTAFKAHVLGTGSGSCFAVGTQRQDNVCVAVARGLRLPASAREELRRAAAAVAGDAGFLFPAGSRACKDYQPL
ncbi:hypothetical protein CHLNCDRAFT_138459 [Chlorella variabilis]|uniref:PABS domain-containing protein n=1 Tax=Chlorella variabilis TaxID=554065 RepID=E1ZN38_CHLVA|nr:hypothetical protein CHLNCDRAFT_138459 [Chlorella variabilis]EFN52903.1 hypothetical protein CHLNCDRAFT_138459 [Chlorella variabilis]|eukprot:XP_005845005.1 hypothetical protein CHLNCDRAFT_138459 [Chlorella variabilis]